MTGRRSNQKWFMMLGMFVAVFLFAFLVQKFKSGDEAEAANLANFDPGYIISDYQMSNYGSMSEAQIQSFLRSKNSCDDTYLNRSGVGTKVGYYSESSPLTWHVAGGHFVCMADENINGESAAHIIWQAAQDYRINPQVLIVLLQKEQGLITDTFPHSVQYRSATGYGCPDTAACSSQYYGLKNQIRNAAALFRTVLDGGWTNYPVGNNYIQYNPNAACGGSVVNIKNRATSALYRYTPYQPNAGALAAGYGTTASCGAYGNRNFYLYFEDWFGGITATQSSIRIPDGIYYIKATKDINMALDVAGGADMNGTNIQLYSSNGTTAQQWKITYNVVTDDYNIVSLLSGRKLDVAGAGIKDGTNVQLWENTDSCAQRWKIVGVGGDDVKFVSACSVKVLDIVNADTRNGTNIHLWSDNGSLAQKWELIPVDTLGEDGLYTIQLNKDKAKVVDISGGVNNARNGTNVQLYSSNNTGAQRWRIKKESDGYFVISNPQTGKVIDVVNGSDKIGTNIQLYQPNGACAQRWKILKNGDGTYTFMAACSNKVFDLIDGNNRNGANIRLWDANNSDAQKWMLSKIDILNNGEYEIISALSDNKALDLAGNQIVDGANIQLYDNNGSSAQRWKVTYDANRDYYSIMNSGTKKSIDAAGAGTWNGVNIHQWSSNGCCAQKWTIFKDGVDKYVITSGCSNLVVDVMNGNKNNGTNIRLWERNGSNAQKWKFKQK